MIEYTREDNIALIAWNLPGSANVLNEASVRAFSEAIETALDDADVAGIVVTSARKHFILGGDLNEIYALPDVATTVALTRGIHQVLRRLETGGKPVACAINGLALGGGLEVALACHFRAMLNHPKVYLAFPEIEVGLFPGAGGTQRLPRLVGLQPAMMPLLTAQKLRAATAHNIGLVQAVADTPEAVLAAAKDYIRQGGSATQPWDRKGFEVPGMDMTSVQTTFLYAGTAGMVRQRTGGNYPAAQAILDCLYEGLQMNFDQALEVEIRHFAQVAQSPVARNMMRTLWFNLNEAKSGVRATPPDLQVPPPARVGILGAGMMGAGIAYVTAQAGLPTVLKDVSPEAAEKGKDYARKLLHKQIDRGRTTPAKADELLARISTTGDPSGVADCDIVIEAVFEDIDLKAEVTQESEAVLPPTAIFASNTSTLPITKLAEASQRPGNFIGLHFFSPVDKMQLVEIILGAETAPETLAASVAYIRQIRKVPIVVNDRRGFFTSRIFKTFVAEGMELLAEGVKPALIENAAKQVGMPVGPLAVADEVSIELLYEIRKQYENAGIEEPGALREVVNLMVERLDRKGKKQGKGFYEYPEGGKKRLWRELGTHFPLADVQPEVEEVKKRILHVQALESVRCLEEGVLRDPKDADIGSILGWGFPPYTGGVISYIDLVGISAFVSNCEEFADRLGERFRPTERLREMAANRTAFYPAKPVPQV
ncbi:MAG: 3-hydroxyacyl-CoA dehydrogenase NAD-binding domain-containing protein [Bacteroidota bacterium]